MIYHRDNMHLQVRKCRDITYSNHEISGKTRVASIFGKHAKHFMVLFHWKQWSYPFMQGYPAPCRHVALFPWLDLCIDSLSSQYFAFNVALSPEMSSPSWHASYTRGHVRSIASPQLSMV